MKQQQQQFQFQRRALSVSSPHQSVNSDRSDTEFDDTVKSNISPIFTPF